MGNTCCFSGSRRNNRVLPTTSTVLTFGVRNNDLDLYRRHRKKDDAESRLSMASGSVKGKKRKLREDYTVFYFNLYCPLLFMFPTENILLFNVNIHYSFCKTY